MRGRVVVAAVAVLGVAAAVALASAPTGQQAQGGATRPSGGIDLEAVRAFGDFRVYWAGHAHGGLPLAAITRRAPPAGERPGYAANYVSFLYGGCAPAGETGCPLPLEIQTWPACVRTLADYRLTPFSDELLPHTRLTARGVPAALFAEAPGLVRLELYTGRETVVLFGHGRSQLVAAADALRGVNTPLAPPDDLLRPEPGATAGRLDC